MCIRDSATTVAILQSMGATVTPITKNTLQIDPTTINCTDVPHELTKYMRGSYYFIGSILGRYGEAREMCIRDRPNTVVLLYNGESVAMPWIDRVAGVLDLWFSGEGSGRAAAEIVWGLQNPSGRLPVTLPKRLEDTPAYLNFPGAGDSHFYCEGIYAGYRYYDKKRVEPLYPFGYGLSYTDFAYSEPQLSTRELALPGRVCFSCQVENTGSMAGAEVVQLYLRDRCSKLPRPCLLYTSRCV